MRDGPRRRPRRRVAALPAVGLVIVPAVAQPATQAAPTPPAAEGGAAERTVHALPFGSQDHAVELAVGGDAPAGAAVEVAAAPPWLAVPERSVPAVAVEGGEPVGRVAFGVAPDAPVGEPGALRLQVVGPGGAVLAEREVWVEVAAPAALALSPPRPNPSRGAVRLTVAVPARSHVRAAAYDVLGREVEVLVDDEMAPGAHDLAVWPGALAAGVYVVRVVASPVGGGAAEARVRRLTVVR